MSVAVAQEVDDVVLVEPVSVDVGTTPGLETVEPANVEV